jgi:flagellar basal-body rod modification protein FlgD
MTTSIASPILSPTQTATQGSASGSSGVAAGLAAGQQSLSSTYSTFLTLLTTQLRNQDPTSPMDTNTFTQQLVSMTGVQQQLLTNQLLQQMVTNQGGASVAGAVGLIGQQATAASSTATLAGGKANWTYTLPEAASQGTATITDGLGSTVWSGALTSLGAGPNSFVWNGQTSSGAQLPDGGSYTLSVKATSASGAALSPSIAISGTVQSVQSVGGVTEVALGSTLVPLTSVTQVK